MLKAIDVANLFINLSQHDEEYPTNAKLNKLLYFAQGHALAELGEPLFNDKIEAWKFGPVVPDVYHTFRACGNNPIPYTYGELNSHLFSQEQLDIIFDTLREYGKFTGSYLITKTHQPGTPWNMVYTGEKHIEIPNDIILEYFKTQSLPHFNYEIPENDFIGYTDENGYTVLPKELDDGEYW